MTQPAMAMTTPGLTGVTILTRFPELPAVELDCHTRWRKSGKGGHMSTQEKLRPIATRVLFEDDEVRVWDQVIGAGETLGKHHHELDYVIVNVTDSGPFDVEFFDKEGNSKKQSFTLPNSKRGGAALIEKGHVEIAHNRGPRFRAILVELKDPK